MSAFFLFTVVCIYIYVYFLFKRVGRKIKFAQRDRSKADCCEPSASP